MKKFEEIMDGLNFTDKNYLQEYLHTKQMKYAPLLDFMVRVNGRVYDTLYEAIELPALKTLEVVFTSPRMWGEWHFNDAIQEIRMLPNGIGSVKVLSGKVTPQSWMFEKHSYRKAMVRIIVEKSYRDGGRGLLAPSRLFELMKKGVIPFIIRVVCYTKDARYKVDLNIPNGDVIDDFRHGKIPPRIFKRRTLEEYMRFDKMYSTIDIPRFPKKVWEAIFESEGIDKEILALIFNVSENIIENNIAVLKKYGLVEEDEKKGIYKAII